MNLRQFGKRKLDFERLEEIIAILAKYEFIDVLKKTGLKKSFRKIRCLCSRKNPPCFRRIKNNLY
jgi:hypothetical protein